MLPKDYRFGRPAMNGMAHTAEIRCGRFSPKFAVYSDLPSYGSILKPSLHEFINGIFYVSHINV
jgi:hypothetical protein